MAEGKASFVLYTDLIHLVRKLPREIRGDLFLIILEYVNDNLSIVEVMEEADILLSVTFEPIKQQLKRDLKKYEKRQQQRIDAGRRSAEARAAQRNATTVDDNLISSGVSVSVNGNVNGSGNVNGNVISKDIERENTETPPPENTFNNFKNKMELDLDSCFENVMENELYLETISMNNHFANIEITKQWIRLFYKKLQNEGVTEKSINDFKSHFARWLNIEIKNKNGTKTGKHSQSIDTEEGQRDLINAVATGIARAEYERNLTVSG